MIRIKPIAASMPLMTADGKNAPMTPARRKPIPTCRRPDSATASSMASKPSFSTAVATMTVRPAAGPETLNCEPLTRRHDKPADDPGDNAGEGRSAGRDRNAEAQRHRDEKHHDPRRNVMIEVADVVVEMSPKHA